MRGAAPSLLCQNDKEARELRRRLGLSQSAFWGALEVTQSGGSRYESSREMPEQVALLTAYGLRHRSTGAVTAGLSEGTREDEHGRQLDGAERHYRRGRSKGTHKLPSR